METTAVSPFNILLCHFCKGSFGFQLKNIFLKKAISQTFLPHFSYLSPPSSPSSSSCDALSVAFLIASTSAGAESVFVHLKSRQTSEPEVVKSVSGLLPSDPPLVPDAVAPAPEAVPPPLNLKNYTQYDRLNSSLITMKNSW